MFAASPLPPSAPPAASPSRRVLDAYEKLIIGCGVVGLIVVAAAIIGLPAPDAGAADTAPTVVVVSPPTVAPEVGATFRADSIAPLPSVAAQPRAVIRPAVAKAVVKKPPQIVKSLVPARAPGSLCERHVSAEAWNDAFEACTAEAANGKALAQRRLALLYVEGHGTGRSEQQATKWFSDAANNGDTESMYQFALSLERGRGIKKDHSAALRWFTSAGDNGHAASQYALGQAFERGRISARKDKRQALEWYRKAADQNYSDAAQKVRDLSR